jgi:hypothetical protein
MFRFGITFAVVAALAYADAFTFTIGGSVATQDFRFKTAAFVFRTDGCSDPAKAQVRGTAEGLVNGERRSVALKVVATSKPGVYAVNQNWPAEGAWVVNLKGSCDGANAGAVVPIGPHSFIRESAKFFPRAATNVEIDTSLKVLAQGEHK